MKLDFEELLVLPLLLTDPSLDTVIAVKVGRFLTGILWGCISKLSFLNVGRLVACGLVYGKVVLCCVSH